MTLECLIPREVVARRVAELAGEIGRASADVADLSVVVLLNGALIFAADLVRQLNVPLTMDTLAVASYEQGHSTGLVAFRSPLKLNPEGRDMLVVDDILDSGLTLRRVMDSLRSAGAARVRSCVLLDKAAPRHPEGLARADFTAFQVPDKFIVGYGLDADERYRNLPDVMALIR